MEWFEQAQEAERRQDWDTAIAVVSAHAARHSGDEAWHDSHFWHMHLLAQAGRLPELAERAPTCVHARRKLNRALSERGRETELRTRAEDGDRDALYVVLRLLCVSRRVEEARRVVRDVAPEHEYAHGIVARY
ncbi:hypothetical protein ACGFRB_28840 [Streptomyces sp. NPDC048718]|uniref:hypothetical protein n=1 Tax=Streptomyces sp. NPDC048718 TaxID=3365587 RepID=UPI00371C7D36